MARCISGEACFDAFQSSVLDHEHPGAWPMIAMEWFLSCPTVVSGAAKPEARSGLSGINHMAA